MSDEQISNPEPEAAKPAMGSPCEVFIASELERARKSLLTTRIAAIGVLIIIGGGLLYITSGFARALEPHQAAEIADGMISTQVNERGPELANQLKEKIPELIAQTPDFVLREIPEQRRALEDRVDEELTKYCQSTADQLGTRLDNYLAAHKDEIKGMFETSTDAAAVRELGPTFKKEMLAYFKEAPNGGESIMDQVDQSLKALQDVSKRVKRLAANKGLTPAEAKTRKAIAVLARAIEAQRVQLTASR
jgi:hypothetical protein